MIRVLGTDLLNPADLSAAVVTPGFGFNYTSSVDVQLRLSNLDANAATFTFFVVHRASDNTTILARYPFAIAKPKASDTVFRCSLGVFLVDANEYLAIESDAAMSSNVADTAVQLGLIHYDNNAVNLYYIADQVGPASTLHDILNMSDPTLGIKSDIISFDGTDIVSGIGIPADIWSINGNSVNGSAVPAKVVSWFGDPGRNFGPISAYGGGTHTITALDVDPDADFGATHTITALNADPDSPAGTATVISFDDVSGWSVGDSLRTNSSIESIVITDITGLDITVTRGANGSNPSALNVGDSWQKWPATYITFDSVAGFQTGHTLKYQNGGTERFVINQIVGNVVRVGRCADGTPFTALGVDGSCTSTFFGSGATSFTKFYVGDATGLKVTNVLGYGEELMRILAIDGTLITVERAINNQDETWVESTYVLQVPHPHVTDPSLIGFAQRATHHINQGSFTPDPQNATALTFDDLSQWRVGEVLQNDAGSELMLIRAIDNNGTDITVTRGYLGTSKQNLTNGMFWYRLAVFSSLYGNISGSTNVTSYVKRGSPLSNLPFIMKDAATGDPVPSKTVTCTVSKDGAAFGAQSLSNGGVAPAEISSGAYKLSVSGNDTDAQYILLRLTASGCKDTFERIITFP